MVGNGMAQDTFVPRRFFPRFEKYERESGIYHTDAYGLCSSARNAIINLFQLLSYISFEWMSCDESRFMPRLKWIRWHLLFAKSQSDVISMLTAPTRRMF